MRIRPTRGGKQTMTWRTLEGGPSIGQTGTPAVLHILPARLPLIPPIPVSLLQGRALGDPVSWQSRSGRPVGQTLGLDVGRVWRRVYRGHPES